MIALRTFVTVMTTLRIPQMKTRASASRQSEAETDGVGEEGVQAHAGGQGVRNVGEEGHDEGSDDRGEDRRDEDGVFGDARLRQDVGVDENDVDHREERGRAGDQFPGEGRTILPQLEVTLELFHLFPPVG